jgi:molybdopterin-guanine dinucleotide biosynthesis protein A
VQPSQNTPAAIVLAGGLSSRMGEPKALLDWHGAPLIHHVAGILARVCRPVIVVAAAGQELPVLPGVEIAVDAAPGRGPLEGIAAGSRALDGRAAAVFLAATDLPLLHPAFVRRLLGSLSGYDAAVALAGGHDHPLAAAYDARTLARASALLAAGRPRAAGLLDGARVRRLSGDDVVEPDSLQNVNTPEDYRRLRARPAPTVTVVIEGAPTVEVDAATLGSAVAGLAWSSGRPAGWGASVNGRVVAADPALPLVHGDVVRLRLAGRAA